MKRESWVEKGIYIERERGVGGGPCLHSMHAPLSVCSRPYFTRQGGKRKKERGRERGEIRLI